ncbi:NF038129 family PEP-CTERM protein [Pseudoduganella namucuonensis]|uniref:PEP-CTERM protein-sorting domain-containing protein n=1 Tax=Pseudoduganella namucuonensis TaxID=1035707 RepID=A0A1I7LPP0_9BURK|nr:NF038129 family PEP-CTERM protein [Pseudoduganella namucuonensis]SFV11653.1 PEP-CTERM protein-sorting domain-containing protein [Pseudoduganella namucuonensis]
MKILKSSAARAMLALLVSIAMACGAGPALAGPVYRVSVNTSTLAGQAGYLDFLFLGLGGAAPATARLSNFSGDFGASSFSMGDAGGSVASGVTIGNGTGWNEFGQWANFGGMFGFDAEFDVSPVPGAGSTLAVALLDERFGYLGSAGDIVTFALQPGAPDTVAADGGLAAVNPVPEPSAMLLMAIGVLALGGARRRRRD